MTVGEWDHRQLCSDGACIGVIGPTGTCTVCGRAAENWGDERNRGLVADPDGELDSAGASGGASPAAWTARRLCPDGGCIGVIGDDGRCAVCGTIGSGPRPAWSDDSSLAAAARDLAAVASAAEVASLPASASDDDHDNDDDDDDAEEADDPDRADEDPGERRLCPDGACVGVIGPDDRCKVCGAAAE